MNRIKINFDVYFYGALYLFAIVLANLSSTYFGPSASIVNAFFFIGLDLSSRDKLHESWHGKGLWWKMLLLILSGSVISYLVNTGSAVIAFASFVAFLSASLVDTIVYSFLYKKEYLVKVNGSNVFSAGADSIIFPTLAFGGFLPVIVVGQFISKVVGGFMWAYIFSKIRSGRKMK